MKGAVILAVLAVMGRATPDWQQHLPPEEFAQRPEVQVAIDFATFDGLMRRMDAVARAVGRRVLDL